MKAKDCKCNKCGKKAVAYWPCVDPDIPRLPWCRKCLDEAKLELTMKLLEPELEHFRKIRTPRCHMCHKNFMRDIDKTTGKKSTHIWKPACDCLKNKNLRLSIG